MQTLAEAAVTEPMEAMLKRLKAQQEGDLEERLEGLKKTFGFKKGYKYPNPGFKFPAGSR